MKALTFIALIFTFLIQLLVITGVGFIIAHFIMKYW